MVFPIVFFHIFLAAPAGGGRGGAAFPTGIKWRTVLNESAPQKYIVCNADEGDPGAYTTGQVNGDLSDNNANGLYSWASTNPQVRSFNNGKEVKNI